MSRQVCPEQKSDSGRRELVSRFSQPVELVADLFAGTSLTARICFTGPLQQEFVVRDEDSK